MSSTSSFSTTNSPTRDVRRASKGSVNKKPRMEKIRSIHKTPEKVKSLHRTPSGREPMQKKKLKKEDLESYDRDYLVDAMSNESSEESIRARAGHISSPSEEGIVLLTDDQSQDTPSTGVPEDSNMKFSSITSSMDVNLSQNENSRQTSLVEMEDQNLVSLPLEESAILPQNEQEKLLPDGKRTRLSQDAKVETQISPVTQKHSAGSTKYEATNKSSRCEKTCGSNYGQSDWKKYSKSTKTSRPRRSTGKNQKNKKSLENKSVAVKGSTTCQDDKQKFSKNHERKNAYVCDQCATIKGAISYVRSRNSKGRKRRLHKGALWSNNGWQSGVDLSETTCGKCGRKRVPRCKPSEQEQSTDPEKDVKLKELTRIAKDTQAVQEIISENRIKKGAQERRTDIADEARDTAELLLSSKSYTSITKLNLHEELQVNHEVPNESKSQSDSQKIPNTGEDNFATRNEQSQNSKRHLFPNSNDQLEEQTEAYSLRLKDTVRDLASREFPNRIETITKLITRVKQQVVGIVQWSNLQATGNILSFPLSLNYSECLQRQQPTEDARLVHLITQANSHVQSLVQDVGTLKLWMYQVLYQQTGTSIKPVNELEREIAASEKETGSMQEAVLAYYKKRNNVISDMFKYPYLQNESLVEVINYKQYIELQIMLSVLRNKYTILQNLVTSLL